MSGHQHQHGQASAAYAHRGSLLTVLGVTAAVTVLEVVGAVLTGSLALLADAGHLFTDVAGVGLALLAVTFAQRPASATRTFGYHRLEILAAVANALLLLAVAGYVLVEAARRVSDPPSVDSVPMLAVALVGLAANAWCARVLHAGQAESLTVRGAYLEVLGDLLGSAAVVVAAVVILLTGWQLADVLASAGVGLLILPRTWLLLRDAVDVLLEATPRGVDLAEVRAHITGIEGVIDVHDLHVWTITSGMPVLSAHVVIEDAALADAYGGRVLDELGHCLAGHFDVEHCTFQLEPTGHREHEHPGHH